MVPPLKWPRSQNSGHLWDQWLGQCPRPKIWLTPKVQVFTNLVGPSVRFSEILKKVFKLSGAAPTVQIIGHWLEECLTPTFRLIKVLTDSAWWLMKFSETFTKVHSCRLAIRKVSQSDWHQESRFRQIQKVYQWDSVQHSQKGVFSFAFLFFLVDMPSYPCFHSPDPQTTLCS